MPITAAVWSQALLLRWQPVDARRQHRLHRGGDLQGFQGLRQAIGTALAPQDPGLDQGVHALFQEEGVALGTGNQERGKGCEAGVIPQQRLEQLVGAGWGQRVEPQLRVVRLTAPAVLVLGAVVDQQEQPGGGQALHQAVQERLGLGVNPVQILKHQAQRLHLTFAQQQVLDGLDGAAAALRRS